jgi:hypothetical protein
LHYVTAAPDVRHRLAVGRLHGEIYVYLTPYPDAGTCSAKASSQGQRRSR